jgi:hypothetical protein
MALAGEQGAKDRLQDQQNLLEKGNFLPMMAERSRELVKQAEALRTKQQELIASARQKGEAAKVALPELADLTPAATAQDCFDCQEASRRLRGTLSTLDGDLDTVLENARFAVSAAQIACTQRNPDASAFEAARSSTAAQAARSASGKLEGQIELAKTQQARLAECLPKVDSLRPFLARIPKAEGEVNEARRLAASSREDATAAKRAHLQCVQLAGTCRNLGHATSGMKGEGETVVLSQQCTALNEVCAAIAGDATLGESYAGTAEVAIADIGGALANLKAISTQVGACFIDPIPAGELQNLQTAQARVAGQLANASKAATRAAECAQMIAAGQPPPGPGGIGGVGSGTSSGTSGETPPLVEASRGGSEGGRDGGKPPLVDASKPGGPTTAGDPKTPPGVGPSTAVKTRPAGDELVYANLDIELAQDDYGIYDILDNFQDAEIIIKTPQGEKQLLGADAIKYLASKGLIFHKNGVGWVATDRLKRFLGIGEPDDPTKPKGSGRPTLGGMTYDGPLEDYNPDDPNTPEGKKKLLRERLSELSRQCAASVESAEFWDCWRECSNLLFAEYGKISQDKVNKCENDCEAVFDQKKPQACREAEAVAAQLENLK